MRREVAYSFKNLGSIESLKGLGYLDSLYRSCLVILVGLCFEIDGSRSRDSS